MTHRRRSPVAGRGSLPGAADLSAVLPAFVTSRLLVGLGYAVASAVAEHDGTDPVPLRQGLWIWDAAFYRDIAEQGYGAVSGEPWRFFPLLPLLGRSLSPLLGGRTDLALLLIANLAALVAAVLIRRLALEETGDAALADRAAWMVLLLPPSFVLALAYTESLFLALTVGCFLALRRRKWGWAGLAAGAAALARPVGLVLVVPLAIELVRELRRAPGRRVSPVTAAVVVASPLIGTGLFVVYARVQTGQWGLPYRTQTALRGATIDPLSRLVRGAWELASEPTGDGLHIPFAVAGVALVVVTMRRWPAAYGAYAAVMVAMALAAENLNSLERYLLACFPLVLALAGSIRTPRAERVTLAVCGGGTVALAALAWLGVYVP